MGVLLVISWLQLGPIGSYTFGMASLDMDELGSSGELGPGCCNTIFKGTRSNLSLPEVFLVTFTYAHPLLSFDT